MMELSDESSGSLDVWLPSVIVTQNGTTGSAGSTWSDFSASINRTLAQIAIRSAPRYYDPIYQAVGTLFHSLIFLFGVLGNILVMAVVLKKRFLQTPVNYYIVSLAAADILVLVVSIPDTVASYFRPSSIWVLGAFGCKTLIFLSYLGINASSASMVAFTLERYLAVCRPRVLDPQGTTGKVRKVIAGIWLSVGIYCSSWLWLTETSPISVDGYRDAERCDTKNIPYVHATVFLADMLLFYLIPLIICTLLYAKMGLVLYKSIRGASRNRFDARTVSDPSDSIELYSMHMARSGSINDNRAKKIVRSRVQVVRMLGLVVLLFAVLSLPYRGLLVYNTCFAERPWWNLWYMFFAKTCTYLNSAINPLLYNFMSSRFRLAFRGLLCEKPITNGTNNKPRVLL